MKTSAIIIMFLLAGYVVIFAQPYGTVSDVPIDNFFIKTLQFVHPEFAFTPNSAAFTGKLQKAYIYDRAFAEEARKTGLDKDPEVARFLERIKHLIEDQYLARVYEKSFSSKDITVTDAEARAFYNENIGLYTEPGEYSYLWATIHDSSKANIKSVREKLKTYSKLGSSLDEFKMGSKKTYSMAFERARAVRPGENLYEAVKSAKLMEIVGPFRSGNELFMIVVTGRSPENVKPFAEVKEICLERVRNQKGNKANSELRKRAMEQYPVSLNPKYFK